MRASACCRLRHDHSLYPFFHALTYSTLNVEGKSSSLGIPIQSGIVSLSKVSKSGWCQTTPAPGFFSRVPGLCEKRQAQRSTGVEHSASASSPAAENSKQA